MVVPSPSGKTPEVAFRGGGWRGSADIMVAFRSEANEAVWEEAGNGAMIQTRFDIKAGDISDRRSRISL